MQLHPILTASVTEATHKLNIVGSIKNGTSYGHIIDRGIMYIGAWRKGCPIFQWGHSHPIFDPDNVTYYVQWHAYIACRCHFFLWSKINNFFLDRKT